MFTLEDKSPSESPCPGVGTFPTSLEVTEFTDTVSSSFVSCLSFDRELSTEIRILHISRADRVTMLSSYTGLVCLLLDITCTLGTEAEGLGPFLLWEFSVPFPGCSLRLDFVISRQECVSTVFFRHNLACLSSLGEDGPVKIKDMHKTDFKISYLSLQIHVY